MADKYDKENAILARLVNEVDVEPTLEHLRKADPNAKAKKDGDTWIIIGNATLSSVPVIKSKI